MYAQQNAIAKAEERPLDEVGFYFVNRVIEALENRGLEEQGLYRYALLSLIPFI